MANIDFTDLNAYEDEINKIISGVYGTKEDVNTILSNLSSTHVTANDLNEINKALTGLASNVHAINSHLINASLDSEGSSTTTDATITNGLNLFLSNEYLRKNQVIVDGNVANDSVITFDDYYIRNRYIFVDGYKLSPYSPYNLVSYNQMNLMTNTLSSNFNNFMKNMRYELTAACSTIVENMTSSMLTGVDVKTTWLYRDINGVDYYLSAGQTAPFDNDSHCYNITQPFITINNVLNKHVDDVYCLLDGKFTNVYDQFGNLATWLSTSNIQTWKHFQTVERNEWGYGIRLIGSGYKTFNKNDILDPQYREYKYYRIYSNNEGNANIPSTTIFYDPNFIDDFIGNHFPFSSTITVNNLAGIAPFDPQKFKIIKSEANHYDVMCMAPGPNPTANPPIYQGYQKGWMEAGGMQRIYVLKKPGTNFLVCTPSTITFPIPFDRTQGINVQITQKRDLVLPFPYIIPISVINEDTYYFDIAAGAQGIDSEKQIELNTTEGNSILIDGVQRNVVYEHPDGWPERFYYAISDNETRNFTAWHKVTVNGVEKYYTDDFFPTPVTGFIYLKWKAEGIYMINNIMQLYYYKHGYNKIHDMYWLSWSTINNHYNIMGYDPLTGCISTEAEFQRITLLNLINHIYKNYFRPTLGSLTNAGSEALSSYITNNETELTSYKIQDGFGIIGTLVKNAAEAGTILDDKMFTTAYTNALGTITIAEAINATNTNAPIQIQNYLSSILVYKIGWSAAKIRQYPDVENYTDTNQYKYLNTNITIPAGSLHSYVGFSREIELSKTGTTPVLINGVTRYARWNTEYKVFVIEDGDGRYIGGLPRYYTKVGDRIVEWDGSQFAYINDNNLQVILDIDTILHFYTTLEATESQSMESTYPTYNMLDDDTMRVRSCITGTLITEDQWSN